MPFSDEQVEDLYSGLRSVGLGLLELQQKALSEAEPYDPSSPVYEHLVHGAARRVSMVRRCTLNIFRLFPLNAQSPIDSESLADAQINLHAFLMNAYALQDNWAWAFVCRHQLEKVVGRKQDVGLFLKKTQSVLPTPVADYLGTESIREWHHSYSKTFRDVLAHQVPPYIPPAGFTTEDTRRYSDLQKLEVECIRSHSWERLEEVRSEMRNVGEPCFVFLHSFSQSGQSPPVLLHAQVLADCSTLVEIGTTFLSHWNEHR